MSYQLEDGAYGKRLVVTGTWNDVVASAFRIAECQELELNYAKGWQHTNLEFLSSLPGVLSLHITHRNLKTGELNPIHHLHELRRLHVATFCKSEIRFSEFPSLEVVSLDEWRTKAESLLAQKMVREVFVSKYPSNSLHPFEGMPSLESLSLASPTLSEIGSVVLEKLAFLGLYRARNLATLSGVEALRGLQRLEINDCPTVTSIGACCALRELRVLHLCDDGDIESVRPLSRLSKLREVLFYGTTNVLDGDLDGLQRLPDLTNVAFQDRRHYTRKRSDFRTGTDLAH